LAKPGPLLPKPDTAKSPVALPPETAAVPPVQPAKPETTAKPAPLSPKPETIAKPEAGPDTARRPSPAKSETQAPTRSGKSFFPDTGMDAVFFGYDSTRIRDEDTAMLRANVEYLGNHSEFELMLVGWCDSAGEQSYNLGLGLRRAQSVRRWLVENGIDAARISPQSHGSEWAEETRPDSMWRDRRCEFWTRAK
jgi:outer membrane protein OmpA-like peptidoglycan-associated protein